MKPFLKSLFFLAIAVTTCFRLTAGDQLSLKAEGRDYFVSGEGLELRVSLKKPVTIPAALDITKWEKTDESESPMFIFGKEGRLKTVSYNIGSGKLITETWTSDDGLLVALSGSLVNTGNKTMKLEYLYPLFIDGAGDLSFGAEENWRILAQYRKKNDYPLAYDPIPEGPEVVEAHKVPGAYFVGEGGATTADPCFIINSNEGEGKNLLIGHQTAYTHLADVSISFNGDKLNKITANSIFEGVAIPKNGKRTSQWVIVSTGEDANQMMHEFALRLREFHSAPIPKKDARTLFCTWYYYGMYYNEENFKEDIAEFKKNRLPFDVFLIDECWAMNQWGDWYTREDLFPSGMKWVADQMRSLGYTPGIWSPPFLLSPESDLVKNHPEWVLRDSKGNPCIFHMNSQENWVLDVTYPGAEQHLEDVYRRIVRDWGFRYLKFDFMRSIYLDTDQQFYDRTATSLEAYRRGLEAIRRGAGEKAYIAVCGGHYGASLGLCESQRSGSDVISKWQEKELFKYRQNILRTWMSDLWHVDPDAMMVRRHTNEPPFENERLKWGLFTDDEAFTNTVNQFVGGNLVTFTEPFPIDEDRLALYTHVLPSPNQASRPLDIFNLYIPGTMITNIEPVCEDLDKWNMLTVINWSNDAKDFRVALNEMLIGNLKGESFIAFDFQSQKVLGIFKRGEELVLEGVRAHHSHVIKLLPWDGESAAFLGTDLSFTCGGIEIAEINHESGRFNGKLNTPWHIPVRLSFVIPGSEGYSIEHVDMLAGQRTFLLNY